MENRIRIDNVFMSEFIDCRFIKLSNNVREQLECRGTWINLEIVNVLYPAQSLGQLYPFQLRVSAPTPLQCYGVTGQVPTHCCSSDCGVENTTDGEQLTMLLESSTSDAFVYTADVLANRVKYTLVPFNIIPHQNGE